MTTYRVIRKSDGAEVFCYSAEAAVEWQGMEFATHDHAAVARYTGRILHCTEGRIVEEAAAWTGATEVEAPV
jgi:hypothetical protein